MVLQSPGYGFADQSPTKVWHQGLRTLPLPSRPYKPLGTLQNQTKPLSNGSKLYPLCEVAKCLLAVTCLNEEAKISSNTIPFLFRIRVYCNDPQNLILAV